MLLKAGASVVAILLVGAGAFLFWAGQAAERQWQTKYAVQPDDLAPYQSQINLELGRRIVEVRGGCVDCHGKDLAGATVIDDPAMGSIAAPNITPARLKDWTDNEIGRAIRHGVGKDGHGLFLMPSGDYHGLSGGDLASAVAYLRSVAPVEKESGPIKFGPVAKVMIATGQMQASFAAGFLDHNQPLATKPPEEATAAFGAYLAQACTGCHNPRFSGGPIPGGAPDWPEASDLTPAALGSWSEADFIRTLLTGVNPMGRQLRPPFPISTTSQMSEVELKALWAFLSTLPASTGTAKD